ncbi:MAG: membrane protein [marine bacterium B5-7]|nr:MAG: membrane protein [marine bacterium B5-7]
MKNSKLAISAAIGSLIAFGATTAMQAQAAGDNEKCYGVAKAGKNDCQTSTSSCAGTSTSDNQTDAWVYLPKGICGKLAGGSLEPTS